MKRKHLEEALNEISDQHITEAASKKSLRLGWIGSVAAALAVVILGLAVLRPFAVAKAVSQADYPRYEWESRYDPMAETMPALTDFFAQSLAQTLSGSEF